MEHNLSDRKKKILAALVDSYINTAEPIASSKLKNDYLPDVSSATIRGELATLEELGYLVQPHVSAGRVPSSKAYRFYVDNLNLREDFCDKDIVELKKHFDTRLKEVEEVVADTAKFISDTTNYTSIVVLSEPANVLIKEIKLVDLGDNSALLIVITDSGILKDKIITLPKGLTGDYFNSATNILNEIFAGKTLGDIAVIEDMIDDKLDEYRQVFEEVCRMLSRVKEKSSKNVYLEGANKIFDYPEYDDVNNVKNFLAVIESKEKLNQIVDEDIEFSIKIGKDECEELDNMALVTAKYFINGKEVGHAGVIGPERMDYKKVLKVLKSIVSATKDIIDNDKE